AAPDTATADTTAARAARAPRAARPDSAAADTTRRLPAPVPTRPPPVTEIDVRAARPLTPGERYVIRLIEARNLLGHARTSDRSFQVPQADTTARPAPPPPPDSTRFATPPPRR
ncbi:MAG TPA: hypothetical protein VFX39_02075, partial [Gemmatimonadaceae bacterium]|nr:hypothetical protein [Gemmatimonadaceae bacterium]